MIQLLFVVTATWLPLSAGAAPVMQTPTVVNGDFSRDNDEDGLADGWTFEKYRGKPTWKTEPRGGPDGSPCVRIDCPTNEDIGVLSQKLNAAEGPETYRVTVAVKTTPGTRATVSCAAYDGANKWLSGDYRIIVAAGVPKWVTYVGYFRQPAGAATLRLALWCNFQNGRPGSVWFDRVTVKQVTGGLSLVYQPDNPEPTLTPAETKRGFLLFRRNYLDLLCREYNPGPTERLTELAGFASRDESEPLTFGIYASRRLPQVTVKASALTGPGGSVIPASAVALRQVRYLPKRSHYMRQDRMLVPAFLDARPVPVAAHDCGWLWLTIHVPPAAAPGVYRGQVTVTAGGEPAVIPVRFRVFGFRLKEPADKWFGMYDGLTLPDRSTTLARRYADMRRHGLTTVAYIGPLGGVYTNNELIVTAKLDEASLSRVATAYREAGFPAPLLWVMDGDVYAYALHQAEDDDSDTDFADAYRSLVKAVLRYGRLNGWPAIYFQPAADAFADANRLESVRRRLRLLKEAGALTALSGLNRAPERASDTYADTDMLVYAHGPLLYRQRVYSRDEWRNLVEKVRTDGKKLVFNNFDVTGYHPESMRFGNGFLVAATGVDGMLNWGYSWARDPYGRRHEVAGDVVFHYPATEDESGGPSIGYEGLREGIDDYKYWYTLTTLVAEAKGKGIDTKDAETVLATLFDGLDLSRLRTNLSLQGRWDYAGKDDQGRPVRRGSFKLPVPWSFATYNQKRLQLAEMIAALGQRRP